MDMVPPHGARVPMLLAGDKAQEACDRLNPLGLNVRVVEGGVGQASTIKMCRSVFMKGLPAILIECLVACDKAGVTEEVLSSLNKTYPGVDWKDVATRALSGTALHAGRRAGEMREAAVTLEELGVSPLMSQATAKVLQNCSDLGLRAYAQKRRPARLEEFLDDVRHAEAGRGKS